METLSPSSIALNPSMEPHTAPPSSVSQCSRGDQVTSGLMMSLAVGEGSREGKLETFLLPKELNQHNNQSFWDIRSCLSRNRKRFSKHVAVILPSLLLSNLDESGSNALRVVSFEQESCHWTRDKLEHNHDMVTPSAIPDFDPDTLLRCIIQTTCRKTSMSMPVRTSMAVLLDCFAGPEWTICTSKSTNGSRKGAEAVPTPSSTGLLSMAEKSNGRTKSTEGQEARYH